MTADQVTIGYGDDAGYAVSPGLSHEASDAIEAMIDWCNQQGGINGREIVGNYYDAAITNVVNAVTQACDEVFMLVGNAWALDSGQEEVRLGCDLPSVPTYSVSPEFANAPLTYQAVPNPADIYTAGWGEQIADLFPDEVKNATVMYGNFSATIDTKDKVLQSLDNFGFEFLDCPVEYNIAGETDWKPFAQRLTDCGAEVVYYSGQAYPNMQNLLDDAAQIGYEPVWLTDSNNYLQSFADWNAPATATTSTSGRRSPRSSRRRTARRPSSTSTSCRATAATSASSASRPRRRSCCGPPPPRPAGPTSPGSVCWTSWLASRAGRRRHARRDQPRREPAARVLDDPPPGRHVLGAGRTRGGGRDGLRTPTGSVELTGRVVEQAELDENRISTEYQP